MRFTFFFGYCTRRGYLLHQQTVELRQRYILSALSSIELLGDSTEQIWTDLLVFSMHFLETH